MIKDSFECHGTAMASPELMKVLDRHGCFVCDKIGRPVYMVFPAGGTWACMVTDMCMRRPPLLAQPSQESLFSLLTFLGFWNEGPVPGLRFCMHADDYRKMRERAQMFGRVKSSDQSAARRNLLLRRKIFMRVEEGNFTQNAPLDMNKLNTMILRYAERFRYKERKISISARPAETRANVSQEERQAWRQRLTDPYNAFHEKHAAFTLRLLDMIEGMENDQTNKPQRKCNENNPYILL